MRGSEPLGGGRLPPSEAGRSSRGGPAGGRPGMPGGRPPGNCKKIKINNSIKVGTNAKKGSGDESPLSITKEKLRTQKMGQKPCLIDFRREREGGRRRRHNRLECNVCVNIVGPCHIILKLLLSRPTSSGSTVTLRICKTGERPCRVPKKGPKRRASISGISTQYLF